MRPLPLLIAAALAAAPALPALRDVASPGTLTLEVDATDLDRRIFGIRQKVPVAKAGPLTLMYAEWIPGNHAPRGPIYNYAGLRISANGKSIPWRRDPADVFAFHVDVPSGTKQLDISFDFVSATNDDQGRVVVTPEMMNIQWQSVSLYPAGWKTSRIPISATVTYPAGWKAGTMMPTFFTEGEDSPITDVLEGNAAAQTEPNHDLEMADTAVVDRHRTQRAGDRQFHATGQ